MKFQQNDFTDDLKITIQHTERVLKDYIEELRADYQALLAKGNLALEVNFRKEGDDYFKPGSISSVTIGLSEKTDTYGVLIDIHTITLWECERFFLGIPINKHVPGSKVLGELVDESVDEIKEELKEYLEEFIKEEA